MRIPRSSGPSKPPSPYPTFRAAVMPFLAFTLLPVLLLTALLLLVSATAVFYLYYTLVVLPLYRLQPPTFRRWLWRTVRVWLRGRYVLLAPVPGSEVGVGWRDSSVSLVG